MPPWNKSCRELFLYLHLNTSKASELSGIAETPQVRALSSLLVSQDEDSSGSNKWAVADSSAGNGFLNVLAINLGIAITIFGLLLRSIAASNELWLDEVWTWQLAQVAQSPWDVFTKLKHDNNHPLNTLCFYFLGPDQSAFVYRAMPVFLGTLAIPLAGAIRWNAHRGESLLLMLLMATNYQLIHYGSEARGYGYLIFFSVAAIWLASRSFQTNSVVNDLIFSLTCVMGFMAHATFIFCFLAIWIWLAYRWLKKDPSIESPILLLFRYGTLPLAYVAWSYLTITSQMQIGGGAGRSIFTAAGNLLTSTFGGQAFGYWEWPWIAALALIALVMSLGLIFRENPHRAVLLVAGILIAPALVLILLKPSLLYTRYFLVPIVFLLMLLAQSVFLWTKENRSFAMGSALLILFVVAGNLMNWVNLASKGRSHYQEATVWMLDQSRIQNEKALPDRSVMPSVRVSGDLDGRHQLMLDYFQRNVPQNQRLEYVPSLEVPRHGVDWMLTHNDRFAHEPSPTCSDQQGNEYSLRKVFRFCGTSGWVLAIYENDSN